MLGAPGFGNPVFEIMSVVVPLFIAFVFCMILFNILKGVKQWNHNNQQPVLTVDAKVVSKRSHVSGSTHHHGTDVHHHHKSTRTTYYATFESSNGSRMEFRLSGNEYGLVAEGDNGKLTFQGTRYHSFDREPLV